MGLFKNANESAYVGGRKHWTDVIKNSGDPSYLIWRQPEEDFNTNSTLIVMPGEAAIFVKGGVVEQVFSESGTYKLTTDNHPFISRLINACSGGVSAFNCVVYFVRTAINAEVKWGVDSPLQIRDKVLGVTTKVMTYGSYSIRVGDPVTFLQYLVGNRAPLETPESIMRFFQLRMQGKIRSIMTAALNSVNGELLGIEASSGEIAAAIEPYVGELLGSYGLICDNFSIASLTLEDSALRERYDAAFIGRHETLTEYRTEAIAMDELGEKWAILKQNGILEKLAENSGGGSFAGDIAGIIAGTYAVAPMAHQSMSPIGGVVGGQASMPPSTGMAAGGTSRFVQAGSKQGQQGSAIGVASGAAAGRAPVSALGTASGFKTATAPSSAPDSSSVRERLRDCKELFEEGLITEAEYRQIHQELLQMLKRF